MALKMVLIPNLHLGVFYLTDLTWLCGVSCVVHIKHKTLFNRYLHSMDTYIQWIPTLNGYLHSMDTYIQWIPTFNVYLHSIGT